MSCRNISLVERLTRTFHLSIKALLVLKQKKPEGTFEGHYSSLRRAFTNSFINAKEKKKEKVLLMENIKGEFSGLAYVACI